MKKSNIVLRRILPVVLFLTVSGVIKTLAAGEHLNLGKHDVPGNLIEKSRSTTYTYPFHGGQSIELENNFGDVKVKIWDKSEVRIDVVITANAPTDDKAEAFLKMVSIDAPPNVGGVVFKTRLNCMNSLYSNNVSGTGDDRNFLRVDCRVYMPAGHSLSITNSHGDVYVPEFKDKLVINQKYGTLYADHLSHPAMLVDVSFGKAYIKSMTGGSLVSNQTALLVDKIDGVSMKNTCGKVQVLEARNMDMSATYTKGFVRNVKNDCRFQVKYSREFRLGEIDAAVSQVEIESSHTNLELPLCLKGKYEVLADLNHTEMQLNDEPGVKYLKTNGKDIKHLVVGSPDSQQASRILLTTRYGTVEVK